MNQQEQVKEQDKAQEQSNDKKNYFGVETEDLAALVKVFMENKDSIKEIVTIFKPVIGEITDLIMDTISPEAYKMILRISLGNVAIRKEVYEAYITAGFTPEQAFYLLVEDGNQGQKAGKFFSESVSKAVQK